MSGADKIFIILKLLKIQTLLRNFQKRFRNQSIVVNMEEKIQKNKWEVFINNKEIELD